MHGLLFYVSTTLSTSDALHCTIAENGGIRCKSISKIAAPIPSVLQVVCKHLRNQKDCDHEAAYEALPSPPPPACVPPSPTRKMPDSSAEIHFLL